MTPEEIRDLAEAILPALKDLIKTELRHQRRVSASPGGLMTEAQAADYLRISPSKLRKERAKYRPQLMGKRWRYRKEDLDRGLQSPWVK